MQTVCRIDRLLIRSTVSRSENLRKVIEALLPSDPLAPCTDLPPIELVIPCHGKDEVLLRLVVEGAIESSRNPIGLVTLVAPSEIAIDVGNCAVPHRRASRGFRPARSHSGTSASVEAGMGNAATSKDARCNDESVPWFTHSRCRHGDLEAASVALWGWHTDSALCP